MNHHAYWDTFFTTLGFEYYNYDNVKFLKNIKFSSCIVFEMLRTYVSIWITNAFSVYNMVKQALSILWVYHINEFLKWNKMKGHDYILCLFCAKWDRNTKLKKVSENRLDKK